MFTKLELFSIGFFITLGYMLCKIIFAVIATSLNEFISKIKINEDGRIEIINVNNGKTSNKRPIGFNREEL